MAGFVEDLKKHLAGEVRDDPVSLAVYSVDASIFEITPLAIAVPQSKQDLITAVQIAAEHGVPLIPRGAATGIAGGCIGRGLILDLSKFLNRILAIDPEGRTAICEPGVVQNALNQAVLPHGLRLGPDTSTGNRATLGGMLANNSAGARSLHYGKMVDHTLEVELLLATGELIRFQTVDEPTLQAKLQLPSKEGAIYREVVRIRNEEADEIAKRYPQIPRRASGYNLDRLLQPGDLNVSSLIAGSEGSLGVATEIHVALAPVPRATALCLLQFHSLEDAFPQVTSILPWKPLALELIDEKIIHAGRSSAALSQRLGWISGDPKAVLIVEFEAAAAPEVAARCSEFAAFARQQRMGASAVELTDPMAIRNVWAVRESGLGLLLSKRSYSRAIGFLEDFAVGPDQLAPFMRDFLKLLADHGKEAGVYGHVGAGCMHVRPYIDLRQAEEVALIRHLMEETAELLLRYRGALSGEHGDGLVRSWLNAKMFGDRLYGSFRRLKAAFDPENRMNPGKVVATQGVTENLRLSPETQPMAIQTFLDFSREGGLHMAADLCNGNGLCRKREGLMCPSFQAYGDEYHSTRARAQSLRSVLNGRLPPESFTSHELFHVLEFCLECKGCKTECPSQLDIAKMKSEFLYHYGKKHGFSLRDHLFGRMGQLYSLGAPVASLANALMQSAMGRRVLSSMGITSQRPLPLLAHQRFSSWLKQQPMAPEEGKAVVLLNDTYSEFINPEIAQSARQVLLALGYRVITPKWTCCGKPLISKGLLEHAKAKALNLIELLWPYARQKMPIIGLEPSCLFTIRDDYRDLANSGMTQEVAALCTTLDEFLASLIAKREFNLPMRSTPGRVHFHTHCHQKSSIGSHAAKSVLSAIPGVNACEIVSGCCGLAGSFGYESEHYDFSMQIAEQTLLPAMRRIDAADLVVANGISCRCQIAHGANRNAVHLAQLLAGRIL